MPCLEKWMKIPLDTDILISHTPPIGHGDLCCSGVRAGCVELLSVLQKRLNVKYHVFGHIHEGMYGNISILFIFISLGTFQWSCSSFSGYGISSDGKIIFINASTCDINYLPNNPPIVFDIKLPPDASKDWRCEDYFSFLHDLVCDIYLCVSNHVIFFFNYAIKSDL